MRGLGLHVHHDELFEPCYNLKERVKFIKEGKAKDEQKLRLRLLQIIPETRLPEDLVKAVDVSNKACNIYIKALDARSEAIGSNWDILGKTSSACTETYHAYWKVHSACCKLIKKHKKHLEKLHAELCFNCPWDGESIFTRRDQKGYWY